MVCSSSIRVSSLVVIVIYGTSTLLGSRPQESPTRSLGSPHDWLYSVSPITHLIEKPLKRSFRMFLMIFWTWAKVCHQNTRESCSSSHASQGLEDRFDGANRKNLRHFIHMENQSVGGYTRRPQAEVQFEDDGQVSDEKTDSVGVSYYYISRNMDDQHPKEPDSPTEVRRELVRIPTCAVFHKIASGAGVPHTFVGFVRQWPALPRIVVCLEASVPTQCFNDLDTLADLLVCPSITCG